MKRELLVRFFIVFLLSNQGLTAQDEKVDSCYIQPTPLSPYAFQKMMTDYYNFTILGSQTPTSGLKIETNKPTITLKGNIISSKDKKLVMNLELTGGVDNDLLQVFAGDKLNGYFKGSLGINYLMERGNKAHYILENKFLRHLARKQVCEFREVIQKKIDTMIVLQAIEDYVNISKFIFGDFITYVQGLALKGEYIIDFYKRTINDRKYYERLVSNMIRSYGQDTLVGNDSIQFEKFMIKLVSKTNDSLKSEKIHSDIKKYVAFEKDRLTKYNLLNDYEIAAYSDIWKRKTVAWINVSFSGANGSFRLYDNINEIVSDSNSFIPGFAITYNLFSKWAAPSQFFFARFGVGFKRENNLSDLEKFEYKQVKVVDISPDENLTSEKKGTAYVGSLTHGGAIEVPFELYWTPWSIQPLPGFYTKLHYRYSNAWFNRNKLSFDLGLTWNVTNNEKDSKNLLTVVPYISWSNLFTEYKSTSKIEKRSMSDLFFVNIKFGIPVNIGK